MKHNKILHLVVLSFFCFQIISPTVGFAVNTSSSGEKAVSISEIDVFGEGTAAPYRELISSYLDYMVRVMAVRKSLKKDSEAMNRMLSEKSPWSSLSIPDSVFSSLLAESEASVRYLTRESVPVENRIIDAYQPLETKFSEQITALNRDGIAPEGLMKTARNLNALYDLYDRIWDTKDSLILKIWGLRRNVYENYLKTDATVSEKIRKNVEDKILELNELHSSVNRHRQDITDLKNEYRQAEDKFNRFAANNLRMEKERTTRLMLEIEKQIVELNKTGGQNETRHATLLRNINDVLTYRLGVIQQRLAVLQVGGETGKTFLYLPESIGNSSEALPFSKSIRYVLNQFVEQTGKRMGLARQLRENIYHIRQCLNEERSLFSTAVATSMQMNLDEKQRTQERFNTLAAELMATLASQEARIDAALETGEKIDFGVPEKILSDITLSTKLIHANSLLESVKAEVRRVDVQSFAFGFQTAQLLTPLNQNRTEGNPALEKLAGAINLRVEAIDRYLSSLDNLSKGFEEDRHLSLRLRELGAQILHTGNSMFSKKIERLENILAQEKQSVGTPYYEYLTGAHTLLSSRYKLIHRLDSAIPDDLAVTIKNQECETCNVEENFWTNISAMGDSFADVLSQLDGLASIDQFFSSDAIRNGSKYENARDLFALSIILKAPPILNLNNDSIDVIFRVDDRVVVFKGIGNAQKLSLARWTGGGDDPFLQAPYIGWSFNPQAAWESISTTASDAYSAGSDLYDAGVQAYESGATIVSSTAESMVNTASAVIDTVGEVGGELYTAAGEAANEAYVVLSEANEKAEEIVTFVNELESDFGTNVWNNMWYDSDGSFGWLKAGGYVIGGAACVASGGLACAPLAIALAADITKGGIDTAAMDKYDVIDQETADWAKFGVDVAALVGGMGVNVGQAMTTTAQIGGTASQWASMSNWGKFATVLGVNPYNITNLSESGLAGLTQLQDMDKFYDSLGTLAGGLDAIKNIYTSPSGLYSTGETFIKLLGGNETIQSIASVASSAVSGAAAGAVAGAVAGATAGAAAGGASGAAAGVASGAVAGAVSGAISGAAAGSAATGVTSGAAAGTSAGGAATGVTSGAAAGTSAGSAATGVTSSAAAGTSAGGAATGAIPGVAAGTAAGGGVVQTASGTVLPGASQTASSQTSGTSLTPTAAQPPNVITPPPATLPPTPQTPPPPKAPPTPQTPPEAKTPPAAVTPW